MLDQLQRELTGLDAPLRVCEIGAGTGSILEQFPDWIGPEQTVNYTAIDTTPEVLDIAIEGLDRWIDGTLPTLDTEGRTIVDCLDVPMTVEFIATDGLTHMDATQDAYDVLIAQSFMDLIDVEAGLGTLLSGLHPGGLAYLPFTFDGVTAFLPEIDPELDRRIERRYHHHMDTTFKSGGYTGDSRAGRHLLTATGAPPRTVLAAGGSDWIVTPDANGYPHDEAYFLHYIVNTVATALSDDDVIDSNAVDSWAQRRHEQITAADLTYLTHQLDVLLRRGD